MNKTKSKVVAAANRPKNQQGRSAATREKLLDAAYNILRDFGHADLRSAKVSLEAGVSRGGLLHHYATKELLIAAVFERTVERMYEASLQQINSAPDDALLPAIVADARSRFLGCSYRIMLDILIASGKEKPLIDVRKALAERYQVTARERWMHRLISTGVEEKTADQVTRLLWNMVKGLAVRNLVHTDQAYCDSIIELGLNLASRQCTKSSTG